MAIQLEDLVARLRLDESGFSLSGVNSKLGKASKSMQSSGRSLTTGLTLPIVGAGIAAVKLAGDFDQTMRQVGIATNAPTDQLEKLALTMGAKTAFSAGDAGDAMLELAKGGMTAATIQGGALEATMTLAAAGGVSLADASTYMSNSLNAFGLEAKDAAGVAVALAGGANASSASVESLGLGLSQVAATSHAAGLSLDETVAILSALDAQGIKGSDAGTSLKTMLSSLVPSTKKAKDQMAELGLSFVDASGNMDDAETIAGKLQSTFGDMSEAQRLSTLRTIFGSDAFRAANALVDTGAKGLGRYIDATHDKATADKLAQSSMEGVNGAVERAKGSLETAGIVIGKSLAPVVEDLANKVEDAANWFGELDEDQRELIIKAALAAAALGPLLLVTGKLAGSTATLVSTGAKMVNFVANLGTESGTAATKMMKLQAAAKLAAGAGGLLLLADSQRRAASNASTLEEAIGGAAAGSIFGPWGAAAGGAAGLVHGLVRQDQAFADSIAAHEPVVADYAATFDNLTGSITGSTRALAAQSLQKSGAFDALNTAGLTNLDQGDLVSATLGDPKALAKVNDELAIAKQRIEQLRVSDYSLGTNIANANFAKRMEPINALTDALGANRDALKDDLAAQKDVIEGVRGGTVHVNAYRKALKAMPPKVRTAFEAIDLNSTRADVVKLGKQYDLTPREIKTVIRALGFETVNKDAKHVSKTLGQTHRDIEAIGNANPHVDKVTAKLLTGLDNAHVKASSKTKETGAAISKNLGDVHPSLAWTRPWEASISGAASNARGIAASGGAGVGFALSQGIAGGITGAVFLVTNAAAAAVQAGINAARAKADAHSPSRVMQALGRDMGDGLVLGIDDSRSNVERSFAALSGSMQSKIAAQSPAFAGDRAGGSVRRSERTAGSSRTQPLRFVLDVGGGRTLTGWIDERLDGADELAGTARRMRR